MSSSLPLYVLAAKHGGADTGKKKDKKTIQTMKKEMLWFETNSFSRFGPKSINNDIFFSFCIRSPLTSAWQCITRGIFFLKKIVIFYSLFLSLAFPRSSILCPSIYFDINVFRYFFYCKPVYACVCVFHSYVSFIRSNADLWCFLLFPFYLLSLCIQCTVEKNIGS